MKNTLYLSKNGDQRNFILQGIEVNANNPMVEISMFSLVNQINNVERIRYKGIPLRIPIKKIEMSFLDK